MARADVGLSASKWSERKSTAAILVLIAAMASAPLVLQTYGLDLLSEVLIFSIVAMSLDLLMGYGGLVSFGHAAFFGLGAYGTVVVSVKIGVSPWLGLLCGVALSTVGATLIGAFCVRMGGVAFLMLTLAFAQLLYSAAVKWRSLTGGSDGIGGLTRPELLGLPLSEPRIMYWFSLAVFVLVLAMMHRLIGAQFGRALVGLRENETRMRALGYNTQKIKLLTFVISGAFAGLGGSLYAFYNGFVSPDALSWGTSGTILLMVVLGGASSLVGPAIGAAVFLLFKSFVSSHTEHWLLVVGVTFVSCVMFFRQGIYGMLRQKLGATEP